MSNSWVELFSNNGQQRGRSSCRLIFGALMSSLLVDLRAHHAREFISRYLASPGRSPARPRLFEACLICFSVGRGLALRLPINPPFDSRSGPGRALQHDGSSRWWCCELSLQRGVESSVDCCLTSRTPFDDSPDSPLIPPLRPADCRFSPRSLRSPLRCLIRHRVFFFLSKIKKAQKIYQN